MVDLLVQMRHKKPTEREDLGEEDSVMPLIRYNTNILDEDLMATVDQGLCISLHQPYASLLVAGVKRQAFFKPFIYFLTNQDDFGFRHEGRVWPTNHRGRLWIAAAAKQPEEEEVVALENFYRTFYNG